MGEQKELKTALSYMCTMDCTKINWHSAWFLIDHLRADNLELQHSGKNFRGISGKDLTQMVGFLLCILDLWGKAGLSEEKRL